MKKKLWTIVKLGIITITSFVDSPVTLANNLKSIPSVSQLKSIKTTHWEYQSLQSLARRYNCSVEWQSKKNNNSRPLSRYEFAIALNKCLQQIKTISFQEDLIVLQRLQQDFAQELASLNTKVDQIEANLIQLESNQFSTTTKLSGDLLLQLSDSFVQENDRSQTLFGYRMELNFDTSFRGNDLLQVGLEAKEIGRLDDVTDTLMTRLGVDGDTDENIEVELSYSFLPRDRTEIIIGTAGVSLDDIGEVLTPFSSSGRGAVSRFGRRDPATLRAPGGAGIGIRQEFSEQVLAFAGYFINTDDAANPESGRGLFDGSASAIAQLVIEPEDELAFAVTYTHTYERTDNVNLMGSTGVKEANEPFGQNATTSDNFGLQFNWAISSSFEIGGWFGYTQAEQQQGGNVNATILNGTLTFAFPDLGAENNLGGIIIGVPPVISDHDDNTLITEETPLHIEALYRMALNEQVEITPGLLVIINPDSNDRNTIWVGTVRTQFSF
jgi:hypothetical protein